MAVMLAGGDGQLRRGWNWPTPVNHRPNSNELVWGTCLALTLLSVSFLVLVLVLGIEVTTWGLEDSTSAGLKEVGRVADFVGARARGVLRIGSHYLLYSGSVAAVEEGVLKTITACMYWLTRSVVSAHRRLLLWVAGAKVMMEEGSSLDSGKEEEGNEEEQRNEVVSRGNPYRWDVNPKQASSRSTKASLEVGRLRCRAVVRRQSKVFGLYLYD
eukprot:COSAG05_NODE_4217_length_1617_cov_1.998024_1_plen_214_part_00